MLIRYAVTGDLRFISHHDTVRLFERALARAAIPVRHSEGFNPRPRLSLPLPRPVGVASDDEALVVDCPETVSPGEVLERLGRQMPPGLTLGSVRRLAAGDVVAPRSATYRVEVDPAVLPSLELRIAELNRADRIDVQRRDHKTGAVRSLDLRECLVELQAVSGGVEWRQAITSRGTARPSEVLEALGLDATRHLHHVRRTSIQFE